MTHQLRRRLADAFAVAFNDADAVSNHYLGECERLLFHGDDSGFIALAKTESRGGELYDQVRIDGQLFAFPKPFLFSLRPLARHPLAADPSRAMTLVLYDNAGEDFNPADVAGGAPAAHHVAHSLATLFLFDPTKDKDFRRRLSHSDPQLRDAGDLQRQCVMLNEMANRVKSLLGLAGHQPHDRQLVVAVGKYDVWSGLLAEPLEDPPLSVDPATGLAALDLRAVNNVSLALRDMLRRVSPELVAAAESGWRQVRYLPVSATGCSPMVQEGSGALGFRPGDLKPVWADVPLLYVLARQGNGLVRTAAPASGDEADAPVASRCRRAGELYLVEVPGSRDPLEVPADYLGQTVVCPRTGRRFRLPA